MSPVNAQASPTLVSLVNVTEWPSFDGYSPLNLKAKEIRILTLLGYTDGGTLQCTMSHASLVQAPSYAALSYYWRAPVPRTDLIPIVVNNSLVHIRPTLHEFLKTLYVGVGQLTFWLDVICINQDDLQKRSNQVSMMGHIFATATIVYAWLGAGDADTKYAFNAVNQVLDSDQVDDVLLVGYAEQILLRPYWTRMWVIQEFVKAQDVLIVCGNKMVQWDRLKHRLAGLSLNPYSEAHKRLQRFEDARRDYLTTNSLHQQNDLYQLIELFQERRCVDQRDRVYALLGLSTEHAVLEADYSIKVGDIFYKLLSLHPPLRRTPICKRTEDSRFLGDRCQPWEAAQRMKSSLKLSDHDLMNSLQPRRGDQLYSWFDSFGKIEDLYSRAQSENKTAFPGDCGASPPAFCYKIIASNDKFRTQLLSDAVLQRGDLVYQTMPFREPNFSSAYLVIRPGTNEIVDLVPPSDKFVENRTDNRKRVQERVRQLCLPGMTICSTSWNDRAKRQGLLLVHLNRVAHFVLSLPPKEIAKQEIRDRLDLEISSPAPTCKCVALDDEDDGDCTDIKVSPLQAWVYLFYNCQGRAVSEANVCDDIWSTVLKQKSGKDQVSTIWNVVEANTSVAFWLSCDEHGHGQSNSTQQHRLSIISLQQRCTRRRHRPRTHRNSCHPSFGSEIID